MRRPKWIVAFYVSILLFSLYNVKPQSLAKALSPDATLNPITGIPSGALVVPDNYSTIREAIANASAGDTVFVKKGIYYGGVIVDKSISLIGEDNQETIIRRQSYFRYGWEYGIQVTADNVTISGFTIDGAVYDVTIEVRGFPSGWESITYSSIKNVKYGILLGDSKGVRIFGNNIINNERSGVSVSGENNQVYQNTITDNDAGVVTSGYANTITRVFKPSYHVISENMIARNNVGISVSSSNTTISGNEITDNYRLGITVGSSLNVTISRNNVSNNGKSNQTGDKGGLSLSYWGPYYVYGNNITNNEGSGIGFGEYCSNSMVWNNNIMNNSIGIQEYNVRDSGEGNKLFQNNIIDNSQQVALNETVDSAEGTGTDIVALDNGKVGNYWSDYLTKYPNATEIDASGIGDTPYVVDESNIDHYPLIHPIDFSSESTPPLQEPEPEPFPSVPVAVASVVAVVVVGAVLLLLFRKRRREAAHA
jgi:parallel beta-helix repeat protein